MGKTEKHFDQQLENARKEATKDKKEKIKMSINKEAIKTWTIVVLVAVIAGIALYGYAYSTGYQAKQADIQRINAEVAKRVVESKPSEQ